MNSWACLCMLRFESVRPVTTWKSKIVPRLFIYSSMIPHEPFFAFTPNKQ